MIICLNKTVGSVLSIIIIMVFKLKRNIKILYNWLHKVCRVLFHTQKNRISKLNCIIWLSLAPICDPKNYINNYYITNTPSISLN